MQCTANRYEDNRKNENKIFIILLCGIPASGKSTFAKYFSNYIAQSKSPAVKLDDTIVIEYDSITESILLENKSSLDVDNNSNENTSTASIDSVLEAWKLSRVKAFHRLEDELSKFSSLTASSASSASSSSAKGLLILLDDNFYFRSMRREIYQKCQKMCSSERNIYFGIIYFPISSVSICFKRNENRKSINSHEKNATTCNNIVRSIPDHVIRRMNDKLESPTLENNWEYPFIIPPSNNDNHTIDNDSSASSYFSDTLMDQIINYLTLLPAISPKQEPNIQQIEEDRKQTKENIMHSLDITLRNYVRCTCQLNRRLGKDVNTIRKLLLNEYKNKKDGIIHIQQEDVWNRFANLLLEVQGVEEQLINEIEKYIEKSKL